MSKDNVVRDKACYASTYHKYNTRNRKSHPYNTWHCGSSSSGSQKNDVTSRFVDTSSLLVTTKNTERNLAPVVQTKNDNLTSPHSSFVTPKQSNRLVDKIHVIKSILNPYKHRGNTRPDTNISYMSSNLMKSSSASTTFAIWFHLYQNVLMLRLLLTINVRLFLLQHNPQY
jgi:hypothetical protein